MTADTSLHADHATETFGIEGALSDHLALDHCISGEISPRAVDADCRPYWDVLGTWESAKLEDHELRYLELKRKHRNDPALRAELQDAIMTARRVCGA